MKLKHRDIEGSKRLFEIEVSSETVKKKYEEIYNQVKKAANIPGYRIGRAPKDLLEKFHGQRIKEETIQGLVSHSYRRALDQSKTNTVGAPEISELNFDLEKGLFFKIKVDIKPRVNLKRYKNLPVEKQKIEVKSGDVDKYLSILQESNAGFSDVHERTVKIGDYVVCDLECLVDGKPIYPKRKGVWILVDKNNPIPGLTEGLRGQKSGETREINVTLPADFQDVKYRNKSALFKVNLLKIKEKHLAKLDDEFARSLGGYNNLEDLKKAIRLDLTGKLENRVKQDMENQILSELLKQSNFSVPDDLVERETKRLIESKKNQPPQEKEAKGEAIRRVKLYFILDEIARQEGIEINDEELDRFIESLAKEYNKTRDELSQHYKKNNLLESLRDQLRENKVIDFLLDNANIKEK